MDDNDLTHGTTNTYRYHRCRCATCTAAWSSYLREYRAARSAAGLCRWCPQPSAGMSLCPRCLAKHATWERKRYQRGRKRT